MSNKIRAYEGSENYIFISYAHKDTEKVFPIMEELRNRGYRIWYDDGIAPGSEWPEDIARHLNGCAMAIAFVSPNSMASVNCRREINFALSKQKPFLSVVLEPTEMPLGMELQLSAQQSVLRYNYRTEAQFIEKICACPDLACCREDVAGHKQESAPEAAEAVVSRSVPAASSATVRQKDPGKRSGKKSGKLLTIVAGIAVLAVIALVIFFTSGTQTPRTLPLDETATEYTVYVKVPQSWRGVCLWAWSESEERDAFDQWPGLTLAPDTDGWYTGKVPTWANCLVVSGNEGTAQTGDIHGEGRDIWIVVREDWSCQSSYDGPFTGTVNVHASLPSSWTDPHCWAWSGGTDIFDQWPGAAFESNGSWYTIELPYYTTGVNISANNSSNETGDICFEPGWDVWVVVRNDSWVYFYQEPTEADIQSVFGS